MKNKSQGFTLIELLVTIAIISLLSSIVFASVSSARDKANFTKTKVQGKEIEKAIELSRLSNNRLPISTTTSESMRELVISGNSPELKSSIDNYYSGPIEEIESSVSGGSGGGGNDRDYYYISDGRDAIDEYGWKYACGARENMWGSEPDDRVIFYRDKRLPFYDMNLDHDDVLYFVNDLPGSPGSDVPDFAYSYANKSDGSNSLYAPTWDKEGDVGHLFRCIK